MNGRFEAGSAGEHGEWGVWDNVAEAWKISPLPSNTENAMDEIARLLNDNICALCGEQCSEAHSNTRLGRVCERCTDENLDENGELRLPEGFVVTLEVDVVARTPEQATEIVKNQIAVRHRGTGDDWDFRIADARLADEATPEPMPLSEALDFAINWLDDAAAGATMTDVEQLLTRAAAALSRFSDEMRGSG